MNRNFTSVTKHYVFWRILQLPSILYVENSKDLNHVPLDEANTDYQAIHGMDSRWWNSNR
jgi:hypothetical protein